MAHIYIALVDTPGFFAAIIRRYLKQKYIHVVISMDAGMEEAYSVGRRNPFIPFFAGFEKEDKRKIFRAFPKAEYMICDLEVSETQKKRLREQLHRDYEHRFQYHYAILGLLTLVCRKAFYQKNHFTCSSYTAKILEENGIFITDKHFSLVTPKDFYLCLYRKKIFEGSLREILEPKYTAPYQRLGAAYE